MKNSIQTFFGFRAILVTVTGCAQLSISVVEANEPLSGLQRKYQKSKLSYDQSEGLSDKRALLLSVGQDKAIDLDFDVNTTSNGISIGNPLIVAAILVKIGDKRQIVLKPLKSGETTITLRDENGEIKIILTAKVAGLNLPRVAQEVQNILRDVEGIDVRIVGPKVVIEGEILVPTDYGRLLTVIQDSSYKDLILNLAILSPQGMQVLAKKAEQDIQSFAPNVKTRVINEILILEGTVDNIDQAKRESSVASNYLPDLKPGNFLEKDPTAQRLTRSKVQSFIVINPPPPRKSEKLIRVTVHLVSLTKDYNKLFGFKWQPAFTADPQIAVGQNQTGSAGASGLNFSATLSNLLPKLQSAVAAGYARVLETANIIVKSGEPAKFARETEFPFAQIGANGQITSASKQVGLSFAVTPLVLGKSEDIQLDLEIDVTSLVGRAPAAGPPITASRKLKTQFYVKSQENSAAAQITTSEIGTDFNKDDPLPGSFEQGTSPLFSLLRSKAYRKKKSQFVVFLTPQIIESASQGTEDLKRSFRVILK